MYRSTPQSSRYCTSPGCRRRSVTRIMATVIGPELHSFYGWRRYVDQLPRNKMRGEAVATARFNSMSRWAPLNLVPTSPEMVPVSCKKEKTSSVPIQRTAFFPDCIANSDAERSNRREKLTSSQKSSTTTVWTARGLGTKSQAMQSSYNFDDL